MTVVPISEARATLPALVDQVQNGEEVTLTRHGEPVAMLVRPLAVDAEISEEYRERLRVWREEMDKKVAERQARRAAEGPSPAEKLIEKLLERQAVAEARHRAGLPIRHANVSPGWADQMVAELRAEHDAE